jgi:hypothetical protein
MFLDPEREQDLRARWQRFEKLFRAEGRLWDLVNEIFDDASIKLRGADERDLSLLVGAALGKVLKTFDGVHDLCIKGWGEDALILLRSNVNMLIDLGYILRDPNPAERASDFIAFSAVERAKYLQNAHGAKPPWASMMTAAEQKMRADRWRSVNIKERAERVPKSHYTIGYAFYSSIEHSDAMALNGYIPKWDEEGPNINAGPNDDHVAVALGHNMMVLADVLTLFCDYYRIERPDVMARIKDLLEQFNE